MKNSATFALAVAMSLAAPVAVLAADVETLPGAEREAGGAAEKCLDELERFDDELSRVGFGVLPPGGYGVSQPEGYYIWGVRGTPRQQIRSLREAAYVYARDGNEENCQLILASMRELYQEHQRLVGAESDDPDIRRAWRRAHLSQAKPVKDMDHLMRADVLIGSEIRNLGDEKLGEIEDIVLNPREPAVIYVLVSHGGFLGMGGRLAAIRWADLRATEDHEIYVLDALPEALDSAPEVDRRNFESTADDEWRGALDQYWDGALRR